MLATLAPFAAWRPRAGAQLLRCVPSPGSLRRGAPQRMPLSRGCSAGPVPGVHETSNKGTLHFFRISDDACSLNANRSPRVVDVFQHVIASLFNARIAARETREMSIIAREKSDFSREHSMSFTSEAADLLGAIAGPHGSKKERQLRAWRRLVSEFPRSTWSFNRVHDLFTQDPRVRVRAQEIEELRIAARIERRATKTQAYHDDLVKRIETAIALSRARRTRPSVVSLRELLGGDRRDDRALDEDS
jgi:hypothetical protein